MMGYMRHNAIVVTSWNTDAIEAVACRARNIGLTVVGPSAELINGYRSLLVCPDGSNEGWSDSEQGDEMRAELRDWMNARRHDDGSSDLEWVEIAYGSDDRTAKIEWTVWMQPNGAIQGPRSGPAGTEGSAS